MQKKIIAIVGLLTLNLLAIYGCKKNYQIERNSSNPKAKFENSDCSPENSNNPLDEAGVNHNLSLKYVEQQVNIFEKENSDVTISLANSYTTGNYPIGTPVVNNIADLENMMSDVKNNMHNYIESLELTTSAKGYIYDLFNALVDTPGIENFCDMKIRITNIEDAIINDGDINDDEKEILLSGTSVARYSYFYWSNRADGLNGDGSDFNGNGMVLMGGLLKWIKLGVTAIADAGGAIGGAIGGVKGAKEAGISKTAGAIGGAVVGATSASAAMAGLADKVADWLK